MADWCALPEGVVALIARRLQLIEDFIAFRATCTDWRKATSFKDFDKSCIRLPLLMDDRIEMGWPEGNGDKRKFVSLPKRKTCEISLPEAQGIVCAGSKGWIFVFEPFTWNMRLMHPLTRAQIPLPKTPTQVNCPIQPKDFVCAALSASPSETSDYVAMVAYVESGYISGHYMGFWKPGNLTWTKVEQPSDSMSYSLEDLNYYNGKFYALTWHSEVWMCDVSGPNPNKKASKITKLPWDWSRPRAQFVECDGRLLIVAPFFCYHYDLGSHHNLEMVELDVMKGSYKIITSLGNSSVFFGYNEGFSIDANKFPGILEPNTIYFSCGSYQVATGGRDHTTFLNGGYGIWLNF